MNLLAGHDGIEFGWLVSTWIPHLRYIAPQYDNVTVVCNPTNQYLYEDFTTTFYDYRHKGKPDMWFAGRFPNKKVKIPKAAIAKYPDHKLLAPSKKTCRSKDRKYFMYGKVTDEKGYDIVIHARSEDKYEQSYRNYNPVKYKKILKVLRTSKEIKACSIGLRGKSYCIDGTNDLRDIPLIHLCYILRNAKVCVGTSSGTMHLAHLCGCPIVVITSDKYEKGIKATNKERYKKLWRAFDTPVEVLDEDNWHPPKAKVIEAVEKILC